MNNENEIKRDVEPKDESYSYWTMLYLERFIDHTWRSNFRVCVGQTLLKKVENQTLHKCVLQERN